MVCKLYFTPATAINVGALFNVGSKLLWPTIINARYMKNRPTLIRFRHVSALKQHRSLLSRQNDEIRTLNFQKFETNQVIFISITIVYKCPFVDTCLCWLPIAQHETHDGRTLGTRICSCANRANATAASSMPP